MSDLLGEAWTHTGYAQQIVFGAGSLGALPDIAKEIGVRRALLRHHRGPGRSPTTDARIVKLLGSVAGVDVHRGRARTCRPPPCRPRCSRPRRDGGRRHRLVRRRLVRRPRQGGVLLHRAGGGHARSVVRRPARAAAHRDPHDLLRRRAHAVLRHDRPSARTEERGRRADHRADGRRLRPRAHARHAGTCQRRDGHERARRTASRSRGRPAARPRPRRSGWPGVRRIVDALPAVVDDPDDVDARTDMLAGCGPRGPLPAERVDGRAPRPGPARRRAHRHPARPGERRDPAHAMRFNADAAPDELARIGEALGDPTMHPARSRASSSGSGCPPACGTAASARMTSTQSPGCRSRASPCKRTFGPSARPTRGRSWLTPTESSSPTSASLPSAPVASLHNRCFAHPGGALHRRCPSPASVGYAGDSDSWR